MHPKPDIFVFIKVRMMPNHNLQQSLNDTGKRLTNNKLLGLELIRFISAFAVLVWHYQHFFFVADQPVNLVRELQPFYGALRFFYDYGYWGVEVFWSISGFIFFMKYRLLISTGKIKAKDFFILRFSRLYPLHLVTLMTVGVLQVIFFQQAGHYFVYQNNGVAEFAAQLFLASNWMEWMGTSFNGPIWSISIEVLVYFFFFSMLLLFGANFRLVGIVLLACVISKQINFPTLFFNCAALFFMGGGVAMLIERFKAAPYKKLILGLLAVVLFMGYLVVYFGNLYHSPYFHYFFILVCAPIFLVFGIVHINAGPYTQKIIEALGNMTYSSYLIHFPIQLSIMLFCTHFNLAPSFYSGEFFVLFLTVTLVLSYIVFAAFEKPMQSAIRRLWMTQDLPR